MIPTVLDQDGNPDEHNVDELMNQSWIKAGGEGDEPTEWRTAREKAIKSLNASNKISKECVSNSYKIMKIWIEKGKAKQEIKQVVREAIKNVPAAMREMMETGLKLQEEQEEEER